MAADGNGGGDAADKAVGWIKRHPVLTIVIGLVAWVMLSPATFEAAITNVSTRIMNGVNNPAVINLIGLIIVVFIGIKLLGGRKGGSGGHDHH